MLARRVAARQEEGDKAANTSKLRIPRIQQATKADDGQEMRFEWRAKPLKFSWGKVGINLNK